MAVKRRPVLNILLAIFLVLWSINFVASVFIDGRALQRRWFPSADVKSKRKSFEGYELAAQVSREFKQIETRYKPYVGWTRAPFAGETTTVNDEGDRVAPAPRAPGESVAGHVRFFGGSTMWGSGVDDQNTIPAHFNSLHPAFAVDNHGESGYVSRQALARLTELVGQDEPMDLVIFYDGCNDLYTLCREDVALTGHREQAVMARRLERGSAVMGGLAGGTLEVARAIGKKLGIASHDPEVLCPDDPEFARRVANTMVNNWRIARRVAELAGAELHAFLQPIATLGSPKVDYLSDRKVGHRAACYLAVYPLVQEIIREEGEAWMHDLTDAFDLDERIYIDSCHVNPRGNRIVAERMDALVGHLLGPGSTSGDSSR
jgi:hypothetical protein